MTLVEITSGEHQGLYGLVEPWREDKMIQYVLCNGERRIVATEHLKIIEDIKDVKPATNLDYSMIDPRGKD